MANKKVSQLTSKPSVLTTDLVPIADPSTGQLFKTTLSALGAVIGSAVASVNGLVGVVVLDTDDIQELASPTNKWFTDTRARAALSAGTGISYNSGTGVISSSVTLADLGGVPTSRTLTINGTSFDLSANRSWSIDSMVYPGAGIPISTGSAWGTSITNNSGNWNTAYGWGNHAGLYLPIGGGTLTGALSGTSASFSGDITGNSFIKTGGTSSGFLKADGSVDLRTFVTTGSLDNYLPLTGGSLTNSLSSGYVLSVTNTTESAGANGLYVNIASGSTGTPFRVDRGGVSLISVNYLGATLFKSTVTANSFIKASGTSSEYLMADGSVSTGPSFTYPGAGIAVSTGSAWGTSITNNSTNWNTAYSWGNHAGLYLPLSGGTLTGALSGTSATFSGSVTAVGATIKNPSSDGSTAVISIRDTSDVYQIGYLNFNQSTDLMTLMNKQGYSASGIAFGTNNTERMRINVNGNVGIGTTSPLFKLDVRSSGTGSNTFSAIFADSSSAGNALGISNGNGISYFYSTYLGTATNCDLGFITTTSSGAQSERMRITSGGNVGIGTTTISTNSLIRQLVIGQGITNGVSQLSFRSDSNSLLASVSLSSYLGENLFAINAESSIPIILYTASTERMRITSGGIVAIGTTSDIGSTGETFLVAGTGVNTIVNRRIGNSNTTASRFLFQGFNASGTIVNTGIVEAGLENSASSGYIAFSANTTERMRINSTGATVIGSVTATSFFESSDKNLKTLIEDNYQAKGIESITAKLYTKNGVTELGYYAQDVQAILPSAVTTGADGFLNLSYREVHTAKIARLEKEVEELKAQLKIV